MPTLAPRERGSVGDYLTAPHFGAAGFYPRRFDHGGQYATLTRFRIGSGENKAVVPIMAAIAGVPRLAFSG
ncbi:hypothetical protein, partial [Acerihabitans sp.]|uniref:hypothetical protein n=1 Tax=Acerihabitans sp. TaxID=2811394 RepID=UPI002EDA6D2A